MSEVSSDVNMEPGVVGWNEIVTNDKAATVEFYTKLFGWTAEEMPMPDGDSYTVFNKGERPVAGCVQPPAETGAHPMWMQYINVEDIDAKVTAAAALGAMVIVPRMDLPMGSFAVVKDPQGAAFAFWQNNPEYQC